MKYIAGVYIFVALIGACSICGAVEPVCASGARERAKPLLSFHIGPDDRIAIENTVKQLPSLRNPADPKQKLDVLEIWGNVYKARYRMRFIYYNSSATTCLLMGEEILEYAQP